METIKLLLAEDDKNLGIVLSKFLKAKGYETTLAKDGQEASELFEKEHFDFCILDVMMPQKDGFTLAKEIKQKNKEIPIIFLTARNISTDIIKGLKIGADDYIPKPFNMDELLLRIKAIERRTVKKESNNGVFQIGNFSFDTKSRILKHQNKTEKKLTTKESELLKILIAQLGQTINRSKILIKIWGSDDYFRGRSMDVFITKLRKYFKEDQSVEIQNIHGKGYRLIVK